MSFCRDFSIVQTCDLLWFFSIVLGLFHSIYWGLGGILGLIIGGGLISVAGPTIAFRLFTMLAVVFIILFTMGLRHVNCRDRNYYSVLLNTFNICREATNAQQTNGARDNPNSTLEENSSKVHVTPPTSVSLDNRGIDFQRVHEISDEPFFYWRLNYDVVDKGDRKLILIGNKRAHSFQASLLHRGHCAESWGSRGTLRRDKKGTWEATVFLPSYSFSGHSSSVSFLLQFFQPISIFLSLIFWKIKGPCNLKRG